jgi:hypothetical protein
LTLFDLLFLLLTLTTIVTLCLTVALALTQRPAQALRILRRLAFGILLYFLLVVAVSLFAPRHVFHLGDTQCFDDWCIAATSFSSHGPSYLINLRIASRARRISQHELNLAVYLTDRDNQRYNPAPRASDVPFDFLLAPGQSVDLTRLFLVPPPARDINLVITHEGGFPIGWFIIGSDAWFRKPPLVLLNPAAAPHG